MSKDNKETKDKPKYEFRSGEYGRRNDKPVAPSKLKCGKIGIDCLIKN